jgi:hypothetical protein
MKKLIPFIAFLLVALSSCQKLIDKKKEEAAMNIITNGVWYVEQYFENTDNVTSGFLNYTFQFKADGTVSGTNGSDNASGTWKATITDQSITSDFPTAVDPIKKLNGVWKITDSYSNYVEAEMTVASGKNYLHLRKKE